MSRYILMRVFLIFLNVFIVSSILFFALNFAQFYKYNNMAFEDYMNIWFRLYKLYIEERIVGLDWGNTVYGDPVIEEIVPKFWVSFKYILVAFLVYVPVGIFLGMISAYRKDSIFDKAINTLALIFGSIPTFVLIPILMFVLGFELGIFPAHTHYVEEGFLKGLWGMGIPTIALSAYPITKISRVVRSEMIESLDAQYYFLARAKGLTKYQAFTRHLFRNNIIPVLPVLLDVLLFVIVSSFIVELAFGIEGVATLFFESLLSIGPFQSYYVRIDIDTMMAICVYYMFMVFVFSLIVDLSYQLIDPRIDITSRKKGL